MSKVKQLRSGLANVLKFTRKPKRPAKSRSSEVSSEVTLTRNVTETESNIPISTRALLSRLIIKEEFLYPSERQQASSFASAVDALLHRKNYSELEELQVNCMIIILSFCINTFAVHPTEIV